MRPLVRWHLNEIGNAHSDIPSNLVVDGDFGNLTRASVVEFQRVIGFEGNGVVDSDTWYMIMETAYRLGHE